ncbi:MULTISPECIES: hypothetical protein [Mycobacterium]|jgi:hypothetical protein|uniref:Uncharacterized protein n=1 Tax=Mycobacterium gordonae TaxID=1778 RepID=A0A1A6B7T1_MYCGO|nr:MULTISPECIES: hypothetical protein [Mycobacterium]MBI2703484.1 hypothetical protein [Mycobacterium sp.]MBX9978578.1 hypothetical protein [Mycobacterium gordonae]MCV7010717.1 hypothetical protein [Mycobacterium gordonae]OBR98401.1 hypothetical protein A9W98_35570 [Mycobacterium gordonae]ODR15928.1 hypothetical protein BHQ23_31745 [Mycobacterium gordonae]
MAYGVTARNGSTQHNTVPPGFYRGRPAPISQPPVRPAAPPAVRPAAPTELTKVSIYLDEPTDAFLETVRTAARFAKPRVDATRSAVVRLALNRLAQQLPPSDLVAELQRKAATHTGPGRKRA